MSDPRAWLQFASRLRARCMLLAVAACSRGLMMLKARCVGVRAERYGAAAALGQPATASATDVTVLS